MATSLSLVASAAGSASRAEKSSSTSPSYSSAGAPSAMKPSTSCSVTRSFTESRSIVIVLRRLLLGHAVQGAQSPDKVHTVNADYLAGREAVRDDVQRMS